MKAADVTVQWLQSLRFSEAPVGTPTIAGVVLRPLQVHVDGRGEVTELWSEPWDDFVRPAHVYQSATDVGVVKCWHLHEIHTDQFVVTRGKLQISLVDVRENSDSHGQVNTFVVGTLNPCLLRIPPGVLHGWKALSAPEVIVFNLQSAVYDAADEFKFPWDCVLEGLWQPKNG